MSRLILIAVRAVRALAAEVVAAAGAVASVPVAVDAVVVASVPVAVDAVVVVVAVVAAVVVVMALSLRRRSPPRKRPPGPHGCPPAGGHPSSTGPAPLPSSAEIGSVPHRDRSGSASRSVRFRLEIGSVPPRDRSGSAPRSVQFRLEIGPVPPRDRFSSASRSVRRLFRTIRMTSGRPGASPGRPDSTHATRAGQGRRGPRTCSRMSSHPLRPSGPVINRTSQTARADQTGPPGPTEQSRPGQAGRGRAIRADQAGRGRAIRAEQAGQGRAIRAEPIRPS